ncbi:hypothetical protein BDF14DRAFT_1758642 [Spinellus fusiger]|nr:hypothetical protein BDF14DRAFT_1758642 [Spinellus fusiger]
MHAVEHNALSVFPASLGCFATTLVNLHLQFNALQDISLSIDALVLPCLKALNLSNNSMKTLTAGTHCSFPCLEELHLSHNHLVDLPDTLATCLPRLRVLKVDNNRLVTLRPKCFDHLEILDLGFNAIDDVPPELGLVHTLKELTLYGNSFRVPRPALLDQGTKAVMEFLSRRAT